MGQIVIYSGGTFTDDHDTAGFPGTKVLQRQGGMQYAGTEVERRLKAEGQHFRKAILDTLRDLIADNNYEVRYEFENNLQIFKSFRLAVRTGRHYFFDLKKASNGADRGHLVLEIERDEKFEDVHVMHVTAPRRSDEATAFEYLANIATDIEQIRSGVAGAPNNQTEIQNYLKGAVSFQRCR